MPRLKSKEQRKMLKLNNLKDLSKIVPVPEGAFEPEAKLDVPSGAFDNVPSRRKGEHAAYVRYNVNAKTQLSYATFVFVKTCVQKHFKKADLGDRFELVQGKAPHKDWFMLRPATQKRGNRLISAGAIFHTTAYLDATKLDHELFYPMDLVSKDGVLYAKLHPDLVPLLR